MQAPETSFRDFLAVALPPFALSLVLALCCYAAAGHGLMLYLGGVALGVVLTPPLALAHRARLDRLLAAASVVDGVGVVWLVAMMRSDVTFAQWLAAYVLVAACAVAVTGLAAALARLVGDVPAVAIALLLAIGWLAWPIWLSAWVEAPGLARVITWLVPFQPLLATNGLLAHLGVWGELPLMYRLTALGQDVPYGLPPSVAPAAALHFLLGGALLLAGGRDRGAAVDEPDRQSR